MKYAWIARHKYKWPVTLQCGVLGVSASGYFAQVADPEPKASSGKGGRLSDEAGIPALVRIDRGDPVDFLFPLQRLHVQPRLLV